MRFRRVLVFVSSMVLLSGCRDPEVRAYRVPKEKLPEPPVASAPHDGTNPHIGPHTGAGVGSGLAWQAPPHWAEKPASGFRRGSYRVAGEDGVAADFSIIAFPGAAGGMVENVNRWRAQLGLSAASEAEVSSAIMHVDGQAGLHFDVIDLLGSVEGEATRITGAVVDHGGESWFFKLMGPDDLVARERRALLDFLQTVTPVAPKP